MRQEQAIRDAVDREKQEARAMLETCEQRYTMDHHQISAKLQRDQTELQSAINHRDRLMESLDFEKKLVSRLERDVEGLERDKGTIQSKYDELKKHYENKRSQLDHLKREINEGKHELRGRD